MPACKKMSKQRQSRIKTWSGQVYGKVKARSRRGKVNVESQGLGKINERLKQRNHNNNHNYNLMGFDTIEINLVCLLESPCSCQGQVCIEGWVITVINCFRGCKAIKNRLPPTRVEKNLSYPARVDWCLWQNLLTLSCSHTIMGGD